MFVLSAEPIGRSGHPLEVSDVALAGAFWEMNKKIADELSRPDAPAAWDLTLEVTR